MYLLLLRLEPGSHTSLCAPLVYCWEGNVIIVLIDEDTVEGQGHSQMGHPHDKVCTKMKSVIVTRAASCFRFLFGSGCFNIE
eukprot:scaffold134404_cov66-Attheya_sp.AAC.4